MDRAQTTPGRNPSHRAVPAWPNRLFRGVSKLLARGAFEVLRLLQPVVLPALLWLGAGGVALWVVFVRIAHDDGFPTASVLLMSLGCLVGALGYCALLESLRHAGR